MRKAGKLKMDCEPGMNAAWFSGERLGGARGETAEFGRYSRNGRSVRRGG